MTTLREAAQQALEMLELLEKDVDWQIGSPTLSALRKSMKSLRAALAQQDASVEPVPLKRGKTGRCTRKVCECEKEGLGPECIYLEPVIDGYPLWSGIPKAEQADPVQEPVAWLYEAGVDRTLHWHKPPLHGTPLYTAPPQRQPLSGLEVERLLEQVIGSLPAARNLVRAVERAHGIIGSEIRGDKA